MWDPDKYGADREPQLTDTEKLKIEWVDVVDPCVLVTLKKRRNWFSPAERGMGRIWSWQSRGSATGRYWHRKMITAFALSGPPAQIGIQEYTLQWKPLC